jgi:hypothetical protein
VSTAVLSGSVDVPSTPPKSGRPPAWLIATTGALAVTILVLAVAETGLKAQYLIDQGEYISVFGLAFIACAGGYLAARKRLASSLPLVFPWLLYPVITQGDQIIDNLSINPMRAVCQVLLAAIFATPVAVFVLSVRGWIPKEQRRQRTTMLAAALIAMEIWLAELYLGRLMIATLIVMIIGVLAYGLLPEPPAVDATKRRQRSERFALFVLVIGVTASLATYLAYKNAPGAYQGSPSFFMDPGEQGSAYSLARVKVADTAVSLPSSPEAVRAALDADARTFDQLLAGYHLLERNYTWDFHNHLFLRSWPLVPNYRAEGLTMVADARRLRAEADAKTAAARATLRDDDPLARLMDDVRGYMAFTFDRSLVLEAMSREFERTPAGLQHAAHLYEGEAKYLGTGLSQIVNKHARVLNAPAAAPVTRDFSAASDAIYQAYADHIVGF